MVGVPLPLLGRLAAEGDSYDPSPVQLKAMHAVEPGSLAKVRSEGLLQH